MTDAPKADTLGGRCVVCITRIGAAINGIVIKHCDDEEQAQREMQRMAMVVIKSDTTQANVRRSENWIEVITHGNDGQKAAIYNISIERSTKSDA